MSNSTSGSSPKVNHHFVETPIRRGGGITYQLTFNSSGYHKPQSGRAHDLLSFQIVFNVMGLDCRLYLMSSEIWAKTSQVAAAFRRNATDANDPCHLGVCSHVSFVRKSLNIRRPTKTKSLTLQLKGSI